MLIINIEDKGLLCFRFKDVISIGLRIINSPSPLHGVDGANSPSEAASRDRVTTLLKIKGNIYLTAI